ncbi:unnamed protein product, partial [Brassica napus]
MQNRLSILICLWFNSCCLILLYYYVAFNFSIFLS